MDKQHHVSSHEYCVVTCAGGREYLYYVIDDHCMAKAASYKRSIQMGELEEDSNTALSKFN
jgi:hypothetical protein